MNSNSKTVDQTVKSVSGFILFLLFGLACIEDGNNRRPCNFYPQPLQISNQINIIAVDQLTRQPLQDIDIEINLTHYKNTEDNDTGCELDPITSSHFGFTDQNGMKSFLLSKMFVSRYDYLTFHITLTKNDYVSRIAYFSSSESSNDTLKFDFLTFEEYP